MKYVTHKHKKRELFWLNHYSGFFYGREAKKKRTPTEIELEMLLHFCTVLTAFSKRRYTKFQVNFVQLQIQNKKVPPFEHDSIRTHSFDRTMEAGQSRMRE